MRKERERRNSLIDKSLFVVFAIAGSAAIIVLKALGVGQLIVTLVPVGIMLIYALLAASQWTRFRLRPDQAGDNCYYLGFIYTLVSLGLALYGFSSNEPGESLIEIVKDFGIALATTLAGVTLRVLLHQLREDPSDIEEAGRRELGVAAARVTTQLSSTIRDVAAFRLQTHDELKRFAYESKQVAEEYRAALKTFHEQSGALGEEVAALVKRLKAVDVPADLIEKKMGPAVSQIEEFTDAASKFSKMEAQRQRASTALIEKARDAISPIEGAAAALKDLGPLTEAMAKAMETFAVTTSAVADMQTKTLEVSKQLANASQKLSQLQGLNAVLDRIEALERTQRRRRIFGWTSSRRGTLVPASGAERNAGE